MRKIGDILDISIALIEQSANGESLGIPTGIEGFDKLTGGLQPSELMIIASRPSMGKTSLAVTIARNIAINHNVPIGFISLDMFAEKLVNNFISQETNLTSNKLRKGYLEHHEWEALNVKTKAFKKAPIFIFDPARLVINDLVDKCKEMVEKHNVRCVFIDYLQLIDPVPSKYNLGNREQEISMMIRVLKQTARELNISIVVLSQLSRALELRGGNKRPLLIDLRDSGAIEDHADIVSFIYRPEYYMIAEWDDEERTPTDGQAELIIRKHRNGGLDNIRLSFDSRTGKFSDAELLVSPFTFSSSIADNEEDSPFDIDDENVPF